MPSGPTRDTCDLVDERDAYRCQRCGAHLAITAGSRHHRQLRRHGDHSPANLILLCGSGTTGCHGWVHAHPAQARQLGLMVRGSDVAAAVPVYRGLTRRWTLQSKDGRLIAMLHETAQHTLNALGVLP